MAEAPGLSDQILGLAQEAQQQKEGLASIDISSVAGGKLLTSSASTFAHLVNTPVKVLPFDVAGPIPTLMSSAANIPTSFISELGIAGETAEVEIQSSDEFYGEEAEQADQEEQQESSMDDEGYGTEQENSEGNNSSQDYQQDEHSANDMAEEYGLPVDNMREASHDEGFSEPQSGAYHPDNTPFGYGTYASRGAE